MIRANRPVTRRSDAVHHSRRAYVIRIEPGGRLIRVKLFGHRTWFTVSIEQLYQVGAANKTNEDRREREARRKEAREARRRAGRVHA